MVDKAFSDLNRMIEQVGKDKGIDKQIVIKAVIQGVLSAARNKYGTYRDIEAQYNEESGEVELFEFKEVVEDKKFVDDQIEVRLTDALKFDSETKVHDSIGFRLDSSDLGRIAAHKAKQIITHYVREAERDIIFSEFEQRKGEVASGIARRLERGSIVVDLGKTEAYIPYREQIPGEKFKPGDRVQGYISDVRQTTRGPQIIMSRSDDRYMQKLFETEVPEIYDGVVEVMAVAREPGQRAKIAVRSKDASLDPVGACVGIKGSRVQNVVQELFGEKIDIVHWDEDPARFISQSLAPAEISKIFVDEKNHEMEVVVADNQLSLAIGKRGQNVRLAVKLTGWNLDIVSESDVSNKTAASVKNLMLISGMTETMARNIFQSGFFSFLALSQANVESVKLVPGYESRDRAEQLIKAAQQLVEKYVKEGKEIPDPEKEVRTKAQAKVKTRVPLKEESSLSKKLFSQTSAKKSVDDDLGQGFVGGAEPKGGENVKLAAEERLKAELKELESKEESEAKDESKEKTEKRKSSKKRFENSDDLGHEK